MGTRKMHHPGMVALLVCVFSPCVTNVSAQKALTDLPGREDIFYLRFSQASLLLAVIVFGIFYIRSTFRSRKRELELIERTNKALDDPKFQAFFMDNSLEECRLEDLGWFPYLWYNFVPSLIQKVENPQDFDASEPSTPSSSESSFGGEHQDSNLRMAGGADKFKDKGDNDCWRGIRGCTPDAIEQVFRYWYYTYLPASIVGSVYPDWMITSVLHHRDQMNLRARAHAWFVRDRKQGKRHRWLGGDAKSLQRLLKRVKRNDNSKMNWLGRRWIFTLMASQMITSVVMYLPAVTCYYQRKLELDVALYSSAAALVKLTFTFLHACSDRERCLFAAPIAVSGVCWLFCFSTAAQISWLFALVRTDICLSIDEYFYKLISFGVVVTVMMWWAMFMLAYRALDYSELRVALLTAFPEKVQQIDTDGENKDHSRHTFRFLTLLTRQAPMVRLNAESKAELAEVIRGFSDRWIIGLLITFLGLLPSAIKIIHAMGMGMRAEGQLYLGVGEAAAVTGVTAILIISLLIDQDMRRWTGLKDPLLWLVLALLTAAAEILGMVVGLAIGFQTEEPIRTTIHLAVCVVFLSLQMIVCVYSGLQLDVGMLQLFLKGHPVLKDDQVQRTLLEERVGVRQQDLIDYSNPKEVLRVEGDKEEALPEITRVSSSTAAASV